MTTITLRRTKYILRGIYINRKCPLRSPRTSKPNYISSVNQGPYRVIRAQVHRNLSISEYRSVRADHNVIAEYASEVDPCISIHDPTSPTTRKYRSTVPRTISLLRYFLHLYLYNNLSPCKSSGTLFYVHKHTLLHNQYSCSFAILQHSKIFSTRSNLSIIELFPGCLHAYLATIPINSMENIRQ